MYLQILSDSRCNINILIAYAVTFSCGEREWFFFIHEDDENCSASAQGRRNIRVVGNGVGFWKPNGSENPIHNEDGNVYASKIFLTYFSGSLRKAKKTHWKMVEYHLHSDSHTEEEYQGKKKVRNIESFGIREMCYVAIVFPFVPFLLTTSLMKAAPQEYVRHNVF